MPDALVERDGHGMAATMDHPSGLRGEALELRVASTIGREEAGMKVLVMGGTMFNGFALVGELCAQGHAVTVVNRGKTQADLPRGVERLVCDRTDADAMRRVLGGLEFDCIFDVSAYRLEDVQLMTEIFEGRVGHYVFISSTVIYATSDLLPITEEHPVDRSERQNEYALNKLACEDFLFERNAQTGFPATVVALSMVFGPRNILPDREQRMFARLLLGRPVMIPGDGTALAQVGYVEDQARALRMLMGQPVSFGRRYNLTGADYFSAEGYVDVIAEVLGRPVQKVFIPAGLMDDLFAGRASLLPVKLEANIETRATSVQSRVAANQFMLSCLVQRLAPHLHGWNRNVLFGVDRLRRDVGWEPEFDLKRAVEHTWEWFQAQGLHENPSFDFGWEDELLRQIEATAV
ncbi:MAG: NAD-dependent epimerase/dehydratase family protein [Deltaproteobacteria bacterium]|nr:NAD-dependent epimerase/dehydratase family protein [Deltaproteobacteria bacterium]